MALLERDRGVCLEGLAFLRQVRPVSGKADADAPLGQRQWKPIRVWPVRANRRS